jgi:hypothetical protein
VTPGSKRAYLSLASVFLAIGGAGIGLGLVDAAFGLDLFRGNPAPTALFVLAIGAALRWTAVRAEVRHDDAEERGEGDREGPKTPD